MKGVLGSYWMYFPLHLEEGAAGGEAGRKTASLGGQFPRGASLCWYQMLRREGVTSHHLQSSTLGFPRAGGESCREEGPLERKPAVCEVNMLGSGGESQLLRSFQPPWVFL